MNKSTELQVKLVQNRIDICSLIETWIRDGDTAAEIQICPPGYKVISVPRSNRQGGGIALCIETPSSYKEVTPITMQQWSVQTL